ncbi:MAG: hypothetical protein DMF79_12025 [Acidobacteria bacterium]|nr:MAG: hypothetical protein DMF79_12025 [Acidobacteriota bacterium]
MLKILEGSLDRFEVPDLLSFLGTGGRTGVLVFERPDRESKVFLREGRPVFATSTGEELRFGSMLVRLGKVRAEVLERALKRQPGGRIGQVLLSEKILTEQELAAFLKVQVSEVIFDAFGWNEGAFSFFDDVPPPATVVTLEMDLLNLIIEGMRRLDDPARAEAAFPDRDRAVEALVNSERLKRSAVLTDEEWRLFFLLDGRRSVSEICRLMGTSDDRPTLQILSRLRAARFVGLVAPRGAPPPGAAPKSQPAGTQKLPDLKQPERPPTVEFSSGMFAPLRVEDDTNKIVDKNAARYLAKATRVTVSRLILTTGGVETSFPLIRDSYTLGRHRNNDIAIADAKVSSFHARIDRTSDGFVLVDLKSRNGCWVNGRRVENAPLTTGDEIRVGSAILVYKVEYTSSV